VKQRLQPVFTFGSFEPLLSHVILDKHAPDWVIVGGETNQGVTRRGILGFGVGFRAAAPDARAEALVLHEADDHKAPIPAA